MSEIDKDEGFKEVVKKMDESIAYHLSIENRNLRELIEYYEEVLKDVLEVANRQNKDLEECKKGKEKIKDLITFAIGEERLKS